MFGGLFFVKVFGKWGAKVNKLECLSTHIWKFLHAAVSIWFWELRMEISDYLMQWEKRNSRHSHAIRWREIESSGLILEQQDFGLWCFLWLSESLQDHCLLLAARRTFEIMEPKHGLGWEGPWKSSSSSPCTMDRDLSLNLVAWDPIQHIHMQAFIQRVLLVVYCSAGKNPSLKKDTLVGNVSAETSLPLLFSAEGGAGTWGGSKAAPLLCSMDSRSSLNWAPEKAKATSLVLNSSNGFTEAIRTAQFGFLWLIFHIKALKYAKIKAQNSFRLQFCP